jgi:predicted dehydrogenase
MNNGRELAVAVIGLGFGANHARILADMSGVRLAAVCDRDEARLSALSQPPQVALYTNYETMFASESLDAVIAAVPARLHTTVALAAIAAGCAVQVEKPLAPSLSEGRRLVEAAAVAGVALMPGHIERFNPAVQELARRVQAGEVGRVLQISARRLAYFIPRGREVDVGVVHDLAYHDIDMLRFVLGEEVQRVSAETHSDVHTPYEDALNALLRFESGVIGTLEVNWLSPRKVREMSVLGERGLLVADYADFREPHLEFQPSQALEESPALGEAPLVKLRGEEPRPSRSLPVEAREPLRDELQAFVGAVRAGVPMPVPPEAALATLAVADALTESARTGRPVEPDRTWR